MKLKNLTNFQMLFVVFEYNNTLSFDAANVFFLFLSIKVT